MQKKYFWVLAGALFIAADQLFKHLVFSRPVTENGAISFAHFQNSGFAFSLPLFSFLILPTIFLVLVVVFRLIITQWPHASSVQKLGMVLVASGGLSNYFERLFLGYVKDPAKIFTGYWNLADGFIIVGVILWWYSSNRKQRFSS